MNQRGKITLLLFLISVCATAALLRYSTTRQSQFAASRPPAELFEVVQRQLSAFRTRNLPSAYEHASANFQQHWSLEQFTGMVRSDYRRVLKAERVEYGPWQRWGSKAVVQVFFVNSDGSVLPCVYHLVNEEGRWKIDSARRLKGWDGGQRMRGIRS